MTQTPTLTATAHVLHNLGLAAGFGGALFGKLALNPAVKTVRDRNERGEVANAAWSGYALLNTLSLGAAAVTWAIGRTMASGAEIDRNARGLVIAKDLCLGATVLSGVGSIIGNSYLRKVEAERGTPMESGSEPAMETPEDVAKVQRTVNMLGVVNLLALAGTIATTAWLDTKSGASYRWSLLSRILP